MQNHVLRLTDGTGVQHETIDKDILRTVNMTTLVPFNRSSNATPQNAHIFGIINGESARKVRAASQIHDSVRRNRYAVLLIVEAWSKVLNPTHS